MALEATGNPFEGRRFIDHGTKLLLRASEEKRAGHSAKPFYREALEKFNQGLQLYPHRDVVWAQALCGRGSAYENLGRYAQAAADYRAVVAGCDPRWIYWASARKGLADMRTQRRIR